MAQNNSGNSIRNPEKDPSIVIEEHKSSNRIPANFQSQEARVKAETPEEEKTGIVNALIDSKDDAQEITPEQTKELNKMVRVRPKETHKRFFYGGKTYQLVKGVEMVVPRHMALVLEQKGHC